MFKLVDLPYANVIVVTNIMFAIKSSEFKTRYLLHFGKGRIFLMQCLFPFIYCIQFFFETKIENEDKVKKNIHFGFFLNVEIY